MMAKIESCMKCGKVIGLLEHVYVHEELVLCKECNESSQILGNPEENKESDTHND